jgi:D-alanyl-D-alanine carboxypeptidase
MQRRTPLTIPLVLALGAVVTVCGHSSGARRTPSASPLRTHLHRMLDSLTATGLPGAVLFVRRGPKTLRLASGYADLARRTPMRPENRFRIGSVSKSYTAVVVLQLVREHRLRLADSVERWLPGLVPDGARITVRELLAHTSGLYNFTDDPRLFAAMLRDRTRVWRPRALVRVATAHGPVAPPGEGWAYTNTGYLLLGLIVEAATGDAIHRQVVRRVVEPLHLRATTVDTAARPTGRYAHGSFAIGGLRRDVTVWNPSIAGDTGAVVSTAADVARFYRSLLRGRLLPARQLRGMKEGVPIRGAADGVRSGLGLFSQDLGCSRVFGHQGEFPGYRALAWSTADASRQIVVLMNDSALSDEAERVLRRLVTAAICGGTKPATGSRRRGRGSPRSPTAPPGGERLVPPVMGSGAPCRSPSVRSAAAVASGRWDRPTTPGRRRQRQ